MKINFTETSMKDLKRIFSPSMLDKIKQKRFDNKMKKQRYKQGYSDQDCWNLHYWLTDTLPKMIYNLRDMKQGAPECEFEEFEELPLEWVNEYALKFMRQIEKEAQKGKDYDYSDSICFWGGSVSDRCFCRWWIILSRIAWCLEQASEDTEIFNEYEEEYNKQSWPDNLSFKDMFEISNIDENGKPISYILKDNEVDKDLKEKYFNREKEIFDYRDKCKDEAFNLIKKYFWNLWD